MAFWTNIVAGDGDAKRNFQFRMIINNFEDSASWYVKKVTKPTFAVTEATHKFLGKTYYFPGRVEWNTISVTLVDPISPDAVSQMSAMLEAAGYKVPSRITTDATDSNLDGNVSTWSTLGKARMTEAIGTMLIQQLDSSGAITEEWTLNQAFIKDVKFSELSYESDDLSEIMIEFKYDWASMSNKGNTNGNANAVSIDIPASTFGGNPVTTEVIPEGAGNDSDAAAENGGSFFNTKNPT
mgnify:CR=1 FL=1